MSAASLPAGAVIPNAMPSPIETIAVSLVRRFVCERDEEIDRPDAGCCECTRGTTPKRLETGLCAHHAAQAFLARIDGGRL